MDWYYRNHICKLLDVKKVPEPIEEVFKRIEPMRERLHLPKAPPESILLICLLTQMIVSEATARPPCPIIDEVDEEETEDATDDEVDKAVSGWKNVACGTPVVLNWHGMHSGVFLGLADGKGGRAKLDIGVCGKERKVRAKRVRLAKEEE